MSNLDAPRPNTSTPATKHFIEYQWTLGCGCTIKHKCHTESAGVDDARAVVDDARAVVVAERAHQALSFWFRDRQPRHQCALVSPENPNGIGPRIKSEGVPA